MGFLLAYYSSKRNNYKSICFVVKEQDLFDSQRARSEDYRIIHSSAPDLIGQNLTRTFVLFYNNCSSLVVSDDIKENIKLSFGDGIFIYDFDIAFVDDPSTKVSINSSGSDVELEIDNFSEKTGFILRVDHSGLVDDVNISGIIRDDGPPKRMLGIKYLMLKAIPEVLLVLFYAFLFYFAAFLDSSLERNIAIFIIFPVILSIIIRSEFIRNKISKIFIRSGSIRRIYFRKRIEIIDKRSF